MGLVLFLIQEEDIFQAVGRLQFIVYGLLLVKRFLIFKSEPLYFFVYERQNRKRHLLRRSLHQHIIEHLYLGK